MVSNFCGIIQHVQQSQMMTIVKLGLSRSKRGPGFMTREPKFTAIVAHAHSALVADIANRCTED